MALRSDSGCSEELVQAADQVGLLGNKLDSVVVARALLYNWPCILIIAYSVLSDFV